MAPAKADGWRRSHRQVQPRRKLVKPAISARSRPSRRKRFALAAAAKSRPTWLKTLAQTGPARRRSATLGTAKIGRPWSAGAATVYGRVGWFFVLGRRRTAWARIGWGCARASAGGHGRFCLGNGCPRTAARSRSTVGFVAKLEVSRPKYRMRADMGSASSTARLHACLLRRADLAGEVNTPMDRTQDPDLHFYWLICRLNR